MTESSPAARRLDAFEVVYQVAQLTLRRTLRGRRIFCALAVAAFPCALALLVASRAPARNQEEFLYGMLSQYHFVIALPVVALTFASAFPWPEAEEGTLTYWFTAPAPRWAVHLGRYAAALLVGSIVLPLSVLATGLPLSPGPEAHLGTLMRVAISTTLTAYPAYLALFWLVSTALRHGLVLGVIFVIIENLISLVSGTIVQMTLIHYVHSEIVNALPASGKSFGGELLHTDAPASTATAITVFAAVTVLALAGSLVAVQVTEYRGKTAQPG